MVLKCTEEQIKALHTLFAFILQEKPKTIEKSLAMDLIKPIYNKLDKKIYNYNGGKKKWNLSLNELQAKVYYTFFKDLDLTHDWQYEHYVISGHLQIIQQQLAYIKL
jgi:hypothetical protein